MRGGVHPLPAALRAIAAGRPPSVAEARHLRRCAACRGALLRAAPDAVFALLDPGAALDPAPPLPVLPARPGARVLRGALAAAAAGLLLLLVGALRGPARHPVAWPGDQGVCRATVEAPGAEVVTFVPRDPDAPVLTLVLDREFDL